MDLSGQIGILSSYSVNEISGILTITLRDSQDTTTLGTIEIEDTKMRAFFEAMTRIAEARWPNNLARNGHRTVYTLRTDEGKTEFT